MNEHPFYARQSRSLKPCILALYLVPLRFSQDKTRDRHIRLLGTLIHLSFAQTHFGQPRKSPGIAMEVKVLTVKQYARPCLALDMQLIVVSVI